MNELLIMEAANLFAGGEDPDASNHLSLTELLLPGMEEATTDHNPGATRIGVEVDTHMNKLEAGFNLAGFSPQVMKLVGSWSAANQRFTAYGLIRNRRTGKGMRATARIWGRLGKAKPGNFQRGQLMAHEYAIKSIMHYELYMGQDEIYWWDFFDGTHRVGGVPINEEDNDILGIPRGNGGIAAAA